MKRISLMAVLIVGVMAGDLLASEHPNSLNLEGRDVVVQIYYYSATRDNKTVRIKEGAFRLNNDDLIDVTGIEVPTWLQKDPLVKRQIGMGSCNYRPWEGPVFHLPVRQEEFEGRKAVVRVYENWQQDPAEYVEKVLYVKAGKIMFSFDDVDDSAFIVIFGQDQEDEVISKVLGQRVSGWCYRKGMTFSIPLKVASDKLQDFVWTFVDGLGDPVPRVPIDIFLEQDERYAWIWRTDTNEEGIATIPFCAGVGEINLRIGKVNHGWDTSNFRFVVGYPRHAKSVVDVHLDANRREKLIQTVFVPTVPPGSEASSRSIWGEVLDPNGRPLSGLFVRATGFYPLGGEWVGHISRQICGAITNDDGRFRIYLPPREDTMKTGWLVPPKSDYHVLIKPPKELGLLPFKGRIPNGQETTITLEHAGYFRTFVFEDENGLITDYRLRQTNIWINRPDGGDQLYLKYDDFKDGGLFPPGTYKATISSGRDVRFESIEVTTNSPEQLVFRLPSEKTYYGRVINGVTGQPVERAFVVDMDGCWSGGNLSMLKESYWVKLHALGSETASFSDKETQEALKEVGHCYSFSRIARTDANGWFEIVPAPKRAFYKFVVFGQDYLTVIHNDDDFEPQADGRIKVPLTKLFPAAKIRVETWAEGLDRRTSLTIWPEWIIDKPNSPTWVQDLLANCRFDLFMEAIRKDFAIHLNEQYCFPIPAGVYLEVQLRPRYSNKEKGWAPTAITEKINLERGQVLDVGKVRIQRALNVFVEVIDSTGTAVEGVPVTCSSKYGCDIHHSDEGGITTFNVAPDARGEFAVEYKSDGAERPQLRHAIPFKITGPEDANTVFTMQLSDEILYHLFKVDKSSS